MTSRNKQRLACLGCRHLLAPAAGRIGQCGLSGRYLDATAERECEFRSRTTEGGRQVRTDDYARDTLDLGYSEIEQHGYSLGDALAASDRRAEIVLAYVHAVATETQDAGAVLAGVRHAAEIVALIDARGFAA